MPIGTMMIWLGILLLRAWLLLLLLFCVTFALLSRYLRRWLCTALTRDKLKIWNTHVASQWFLSLAVVVVIVNIKLQYVVNAEESVTALSYVGGMNKQAFRSMFHATHSNTRTCIHWVDFQRKTSSTAAKKIT